MSKRGSVKKTKAGTADRDLALPAGGGLVVRGVETFHRWTFLTNHAHVLVVLHDDPHLVLREVANRVGITERAVQRIVQDLEEEGFIRIEKVGRQNRYQVMLDRPLRHPIEAHRKIGDLLRLVQK